MIVVQSAGILKCRVEMDGALEISRRSEGRLASPIDYFAEFVIMPR